MLLKKIKNTIKYRINLTKNWWLRKIKFGYLHNKVIKNLAIRDYLYKKLKKKYSKYVTINKNKSPINETKKVWICWFQGRENAPDLIKQCILSVERRLKEYEVIVLTWDNYREYVDIPDYIIELLEKRLITMVHFSDLLRMNVLIQHGGLWLDSTVLCSCEGLPKYMDNTSLFMYKEVGLDPSDESAIAASSWLIYSGKNNNILMATRDMIYAFWKKEGFLIDYFLFHIFLKISTDIYKDEWDEIPTYNNVNPHMLQFELGKEYNKKRWEQLLEMSEFHKLSRHFAKSNDISFTNYDYILNDFKVQKER